MAANLHFIYLFSPWLFGGHTLVLQLGCFGLGITSFVFSKAGHGTVLGPLFTCLFSLLQEGQTRYPIKMTITLEWPELFTSNKNQVASYVDILNLDHVFTSTIMPQGDKDKNANFSLQNGCKGHHRSEFSTE